MPRKAKSFDVAKVEFEENFVVDVQFLLHDLMKREGISATKLAERLGVSKARVSNMFRADANLTIRSLAAAFYALGASVEMKERVVESQIRVTKDSSWDLSISEVSLKRIEVSAKQASALFYRLGLNDNSYVDFVDVSDVHATRAREIKMRVMA